MGNDEALPTREPYGSPDPLSNSFYEAAIDQFLNQTMWQCGRPIGIEDLPGSEELRDTRRYLIVLLSLTGFPDTCELSGSRCVDQR
jgi:hypothetical protein